MTAELPPQDRCPGALRLHEAADGWLARVRLPGGRLSADGLRTVAGLAELGNDVVELTSRGNLQVRGLPETAGSTVAERLASAGLLPSLAHDRVRNLVASPLGDRHPDAGLPTDALVAALDAGLRADPTLARLSGRFLLAVDDASRTLGPHDADIALVPGDVAGDEVALMLAGRPTTLAARPSDAPRLALDAARAFVALAADGPGRRWRISDLDRGPQRVAARLGGALRSGRRTPGRPLPVGGLEQADGRIAVTTLPPLGRLSAATLRELATIAATTGGELRTSPARTLTLLDVECADAAAVVRRLARLGLVTRPATGWTGLTACAGRGACANARADVRAAATERATVRRADDAAEHWCACERACGRPVHGTGVVATADGFVVTQDGREHLVPSLSAALLLLSPTRPEVPNP